jgi:CHAD domain-containing protein
MEFEVVGFPHINDSDITPDRTRLPDLRIGVRQVRQLARPFRDVNRDVTALSAVCGSCGKRQEHHVSASCILAGIR